MTADFQIDPFPSDAALRALWQQAWGEEGPASFAPILKHGLGHIGAFDGLCLIGFVNIAWDGGIHAFILDTCVAPQFQGQGIGTRLVELAEGLARERGMHWLHVDYEPHLERFYKRCGFRPSHAGLIDLRRP